MRHQIIPATKPMATDLIMLRGVKMLERDPLSARCIKTAYWVVHDVLYFRTAPSVRIPPLLLWLLLLLLVWLLWLLLLLLALLSPLVLLEAAWVVGETGVAATGKREVPACRLGHPLVGICVRGTKALALGRVEVEEELLKRMSRAAAAGHVWLLVRVICLSYLGF